MIDERTWLAHDKASARGEPMYEDPGSGFWVFTEAGLTARGRCCGSGCRHCPYAHNRVALSHRAARIHRPAFLVQGSPSQHGLLWMGDLSAWLLWCWFRREHPIGTSGPPAVAPALISPFDGISRRVPDDRAHIKAIVDHARHLRCPLVGQPLWPGKAPATVFEESLGLLPPKAVVYSSALDPNDADRIDRMAGKTRGRIRHPLLDLPNGTLNGLLDAGETVELHFEDARLPVPIRPPILLGESRDMIERCRGGVIAFQR